MLTKFRRWAHDLLRDVHAMWLAARDPRTPLAAKVLGIVVAGYALSPIDLIPDFVPVLGLLDDLLIVPAGIWLFVRMVPDAVMAEARAEATRAADRPRSHVGAACVVLLWLIALLAIGWQLAGFMSW